MYAGRRIRVARGELPTGAWESFRASPHPELAIYVREYQGYSETSSGPLRRRELPSGDVALIISFGQRYELIDPLDGLSLGSRRTFIAGLDDRYALVESDGGGLAMQVNFTPIGAHRLLRIPMHLVSRRTTELSDILGSEAASLVDRLFDAPDWSNRFELLDEFLLSRIRRSRDVTPEINWAWQLLETSYGVASVSMITGNLGWSRKRLVRTFREHIGVPPKTLSRILRFEHALAELGSRNVIDAAQVAFECGYSDQAHMIREFRAMSGCTPVELRNRYSPEGGIVEGLG